jgi:hypothetical protein
MKAIIPEPLPASIPQDLGEELAVIAQGEPIGLVVRDPENGRHYIRAISLSPAPEREAGRLYLEWITPQGKMRTVAVD